MSDDLHAALNRLEARIAEREPALLALMPEPERFARLHRQADELAHRFPDPAARLPLYGVLLGVKDIFHVDGFPTRAGSRLPPEVLAGPQSAAVTALEQAGVLVLGKTVSTEFAFFAPGPTRNPYNPEHTPGGSSSGSAAAVAAGYCPLALGTQTIGSITRPAAYCGVVGYKPSYERISRDGVIPLAPSVDHIGFFAPDVATAEEAAGVLLSGWRIVAPAGRPRLGIPEGPYLERASPEGLEHFRATCGRLAAAGFEVLPVPAMPDAADIDQRHRRLVDAEAAEVHREWFPRFRDLYAPQTVDLILRGQAVSPEQLASDLAGREKLRIELTALMDAHGIDLWLSPPAQGPAPHGLAATGDPVMNLPWTHALVPTLGIPAGLEEMSGLTMGLQVAARFGADEELFAWGKEIEEALHT